MNFFSSPDVEGLKLRPNYEANKSRHGRLVVDRQGRAQDLGFGYSTFFKDEMFLTAAVRCATLSPKMHVA